MPSSLPVKIGPVLDVVLLLAPTSILDIGPGFGKYGVLCREYLDVNYGGDRSTYPPPRSTRIDCVEACASYVSDLHRYVYDNVYVGDATDIVPTLGSHSYDLALLLDVIEHLRPEMGERLIRSVLEVARAVLVVTPARWSPQGALYGNEFERHVSIWTPRALLRLAPAYWFYRPAATLGVAHICLLSSDRAVTDDIGSRMRRLRWFRGLNVSLEWTHLKPPLRLLRQAHLRLRGRSAGDRGLRPLGSTDNTGPSGSGRAAAAPRECGVDRGDT